MRSLLTSVALVALSLAACGGDDGGTPPGDGDGGIDAPPGTIDAGIDSPPGMSAVGRPCMGNDQGNCPAGYLCIQLTGGATRWCSKTCTSEQDTSCADGYTGVGYPRCQFNIDFGGGVTRIMCGIVCDDPPGGPMLCPEGQQQCNGTCPQPLACNVNLTSGQTVVGRACR